MKRLLTLIFLTAGGWVQAKVNWIDKPVDHPPIPLLDEEGKHVLLSGKPYSPRKTCAGSGCHDYDKISSAYHFEMGRDQTRDDWGLLHNWFGASHLVGPGWFGGYNCMSGNIPAMLSKKANASPEEFKDYGAADFIAGCSSCHAGGGFGEKDRLGNFYTQMPDNQIALWDGDYYARMKQGAAGSGGHGGHGGHGGGGGEEIARWDWHKSGLLENDCLFCHASETNMALPDERLKDTNGMIPAYRRARAAFLSGGAFRYAASTAWEFLQVTGKNGQTAKALTIEREWGDGTAYSLKKDADGNPVIHWNSEAFDDQGRIHVKMLRMAENENCMTCHTTSTSRRGFYGFGDVARMELSQEDGGTLVNDYKDDVHKDKDLGKYWVHTEARIIDNCNVCHARGYFKTKFEPVDLNMDHNFLKGNSDMDVRNDLDFAAGIRTCEYCHLEGANPNGEKPIVPSGQSSLLTAHLERWKHSGFLAGYTQDSLEKIVKTHFDVLNCQTCHISRLQTGDTTPLQIMYRYRDDQDSKRKIVAYNPRTRYLWIETTSTPMHALSRYERGLVLKAAVDETGQPLKDPKGQLLFDIVDPETKQPLGGRVTGSQSHGSITPGDPVDANSYRLLKQAYDKLMKIRLGIPNPDTKLVWLESNEYIITHNTRPAVEALACGECHTQKQNGSFSSLLAQDGVLGEGNRKIVAKLPDPKLVEEGVVVLGVPYMRVAEDGTIYESESDILFASLVDPFMTINRASSSRFGLGKFSEFKVADAAASLGLNGEALSQALGGDSFYGWSYRYGHPSLRSLAFGLTKTAITEALIEDWQADALIFDKTPELADLLRQRGFGQLESDAMRLTISDQQKAPLSSLLGSRLVVHMTHQSSRGVDGIQILTSPDGRQIFPLGAQAIIDYRPAQDGEPGGVVFTSEQAGYFAVVER